MRYILGIFLSLLLIPTVYAERIKDLATVEGVRGNALIGYGLVVGLNGTGDTYNYSPFTIKSITAMLDRFGVNVRADIKTMKPENIAAVMVTAELPAFARPGQNLDMTVSSMGDSESLRGGTLLITPLLGGDGQVYVVAQGAISVGGFALAGKGKSVTKNHPTVGKVPNGGRVERAAPNGFRSNQAKVVLRLNHADFTTVRRMQQAINRRFGQKIALAVDAGTVEVKNFKNNAVMLMGDLEQVELTTDHAAIVVVDERTGTIVMGQEVKIDMVAVAHGNIHVSVGENPNVSQPNAFSEGKTTTTDNTTVTVKEDAAKLVVLPRQVSLTSLVSALNSVGASPSDMISVLQAIKAAGALHAELKVI
ncbi:MAG: flagellar basal body P-ring protein FlgI [Mariprofundaceae bacterium]|nr:flagellar basal body P-ring protein FlgI [Mariprofundaceae bacterium]